jgi:hypothetical protein
MQDRRDLHPEYLAKVARIRATSFYNEAIQAVLDNRAVKAALGKPIEFDLPKGSIHDLHDGPEIQRELSRMYLKTMLDMMGHEMPLSEPRSFANISIAIRGPLANGELTQLRQLKPKDFFSGGRIVVVASRRGFILANRNVVKTKLLSRHGNFPPCTCGDASGPRTANATPTGRW